MAGHDVWGISELADTQPKIDFSKNVGPNNDLICRTMDKEKERRNELRCKVADVEGPTWGYQPSAKSFIHLMRVGSPEIAFLGFPDNLG